MATERKTETVRRSGSSPDEALKRLEKGINEFLELPQDPRVKRTLVNGGQAQLIAWPAGQTCNHGYFGFQTLTYDQGPRG